MPLLFTLIFLLTNAHSSIVPGEHLVREYKVSEQKAEEIIRDKLNFLRLTYEQYRHPTFKYSKFPHACMKAIEINDRVEKDYGLLSKSNIYYGENFHPGLCPQHSNAIKGSFILLYCRKTSTLKQIRCSADLCDKIDWGLKC